jgi:general nucleoside transport system ATP-binding protein
MKSQPIIKMRSITKRFPGVTANDAVDLDLFPGEVHTLLGENGAGKSTLMHILAGMVQPEAGRIEVNERPVKIRSPVDALKLGIGMVYQHFALVPNLTAMENIIIGFEDGFVLRWRRLESRLKKILDAYALSLPLNEKVSNLSVGEQQRVEIVKALFHESDVLILDEPTSVLTPHETDELFKTVSALVREGKSVVFITHKLKEARRCVKWMPGKGTGRSLMSCLTINAFRNAHRRHALLRQNRFWRWIGCFVRETGEMNG